MGLRLLSIRFSEYFFGRRICIFRNIFFCLASVLILSSSSNLFAGSFTPSEYTVAGQELAEWFILSTKHEDVISATEFGRYAHISTYREKEDPHHWAFEFGASRSAYPIDAKTASSFNIFGIAPEELPPNIYLTRFHVTKAFSPRFSANLSYLSSQGTGISGGGIGFVYSFLHLGDFFTAINLKGGYVEKSDFLNAKSYGIDLIESYNPQHGPLDYFFGLRYTDGTISFIPKTDQYEFKNLRYQTTPGRDFFIGFGVAPFPFVRVTGEAVFERGRSPGLLLKLTFKLQSNRENAPFLQRQEY